MQQTTIVATVTLVKINSRIYNKMFVHINVYLLQLTLKNFTFHSKGKILPKLRKVKRKKGNNSKYRISITE